MNTDSLIYKNLVNAAKETIKDIDLLSQDITKSKTISKIARARLQLIQTNLRVSHPPTILTSLIYSKNWTSTLRNSSNWKASPSL